MAAKARAAAAQSARNMAACGWGSLPVKEDCLPATVAQAANRPASTPTAPLLRTIASTKSK